MGAVVGGQPEAPPALAPHLLVRINEILPLLALCSEDTGPFVPGLGVLLLPHLPSAATHSHPGLLVSAHSGHTQKPISHWTPQTLLAPKDSCFPSVFQQAPNVDLQQYCSPETKLFGFWGPLG